MCVYNPQHIVYNAFARTTANNLRSRTDIQCEEHLQRDKMKTNCYKRHCKWRQSIHTKCILCHETKFMWRRWRQYINHWQKKKAKRLNLLSPPFAFNEPHLWRNAALKKNSWLQTMQLFDIRQQEKFIFKAYFTIDILLLHSQTPKKNGIILAELDAKDNPNGLFINHFGQAQLFNRHFSTIDSWFITCCVLDFI